jgi:hypothetical protein
MAFLNDDAERRNRPKVLDLVDISASEERAITEHLLDLLSGYRPEQAPVPAGPESFREGFRGIPIPGTSFVIPKPTLELPGYRFVPPTKFDPEVVDQLRRRELIATEKAHEVALAKYGRDDVLMEERVFEGLITALAQAYAAEIGLATVTDDPSFFALATLADEQPSSGKERQNTLLAVTLDCLIPDAIERLPLPTYLQIREEYRDLRKPTHDLMERVIESDIGDVTDKRGGLLKRFKGEARCLASEIEGVKRRYPDLKRWATYGILATCTVASIVPSWVSIC